MKLVKGIAVLSAAAGTVFAAEPPVTQTPPVFVTATRFEEPYLDRPVNATVITAEDIRRSTARTVPELLFQQAGIMVRDFFGNNADSTTVDMRGFGITGQQNTLILVDGRRFSDIDLSGVQWSAVPLAAIERIEIVRGGGAVLYGEGATAGVINIITKTPAKIGTLAVVQGRAGSYDTYEGQLYANYFTGNLGLSVIASNFVSDGYRDNNRNRQSNLQAEARWVGGANDVSLKLANDNQGIRLPGVRAVQPSIGLNQLETDRRGTSTPFDWAQRSGNRVTFDWSHDASFAQLNLGVGYREKEQNSYFDAFGGTYRTTDLGVWSFSPRAKFGQPLFGMPNTLVAGVDWYRWDYRLLTSNSPANVVRPAHVVNATQENTAFYLHNTTQLAPPLTLVVGARKERFRINADDTFDPGAPGVFFGNSAGVGGRSDSEEAYEAALRYAFAPQWSVRGRAGRSYRIATVDEQLFEFGGPPFFPNEFQFLRPQTAWSYEAGVDWRSTAGALRATLFQIDVDDEVHLDVFLTGAGNTNLPPSRRRGLELEGQHAVGSALRLGASYTYMDAVFREGAAGGIVVAGKKVPLVPRHKLNVNASWEITGKTRLNALASYVGEQYMDNDETNTFHARIPAYTLVDLKLMHQEGGWRLTAGVNNLLGEKYYNYAIRSLFTDRYNTYPLPERNFTVTAEYTFR